MNTTEMEFNHAHGYHLTDADTECARCLAGELPTRDELMVALVQERLANTPRKATAYRAELQEWLDVHEMLSRSLAPKR